MNVLVHTDETFCGNVSTLEGLREALVKATKTNSDHVHIEFDEPFAEFIVALKPGDVAGYYMLIETMNKTK